MTRPAVVLAVTICCVAFPAAQQPPAPARFEVASIKADPLQGRVGPRRVGSEISIPPVNVLQGGRVESYGHTLRNLIATAYNLNMLYQRIEGKQEVLDLEFAIEAKAPGDSLTRAEASAMMRTLIDERFQLRWRLQPRETDGYRLVPARADRRQGPGLQPFAGDCDARANSGATVRFDDPAYDQKARCGWTGINGRQRGIGVSMASIAERLTLFMATPVIDSTGWPGLFSFNVLADTGDMPYQTVIRQGPTTIGARLPVDAPQLLDVFSRELGLRLAKERTTVNDFVVERVEPLIEN